MYNGIYYSILITTVCIVFHFVTGFFSLNFSVPAAYLGSDYLPIFYQIKSLINHDWFPFTGIHSERLGFPFGSDWNDYPMNHSLFYLIIYFIGIFSKDWAIVFNLYWLITFILSSLSFAYVLRKLRVRPDVAFIFSILFSFMPFHFFRMGHIWLSSYFLVPFQIFVLLQIWDKEPVFFSNIEKHGSFWQKNKKKIFTIAILLLSGWAGIYYVFFFCAIALFAMISACLKYKSIRHALSVGALIGICAISVISDSIPTIYKTVREGANGSGFSRVYTESEIYGLRLIQLYLPNSSHRIHALKKIAHKYNTLAPNLTENWTSTLGMTGAFGLSLLLLALFMDLRKKQFVKNLSKLNLAALLIGTIGGFGSMFALLISPSIRALNRISVFISAFAFICVAYLVSGLSRRMPKIPFYGLLVFIGLFGVWEQSNDGLRYNPPVEKFQQDREFFQTLESIAGDAPVYQLPVVDFPDMIPYHNMGEYEQLRGYLFTEKTKWSYGNVAGRYPNAWLQNISFQDSTTDLISMLHKAGFKFIYLNKTGFVDNGNLMISEISAILGKPVAESHDHTLLLFDLNRNKKIHSEKNAGQENLLEMPAYSYGPRILFNSTPRIGEFAKLPLPAEIYLFNPKKNNQAVQILFSIEDLAPREKILSLKHLKQTIMINTENFPVTYKGTLVLPSGRSELKITSSSNSQLIIRGFSIKQIE